jgi:pimeloyl-ACP methyl ester carboxylesterase
MPVTELEIPVSAEESVFGDLTVPDGALGVVVFAHGSGSSRRSRRNRQVANRLTELKLATLLVDLLTEQEDILDQGTRELRFDIGLLARRLTLAADDVTNRPSTSGLPLGFFGASTGAAAALVAASEDRDRVRAVVSRGGRPDLAGEALPQVSAPTLLIVGGHDPIVIDLNREAIDAMRCERELIVVPDATHLFEEPGALERVAGLAGDWFARHLRRPG